MGKIFLEELLHCEPRSIHENIFFKEKIRKASLREKNMTEEQNVIKNLAIKGKIYNINLERNARNTSIDF